MCVCYKHFHICIFVFHRLEGPGLSSWPCLQGWVKAEFFLFAWTDLPAEAPPHPSSQWTGRSRSVCVYVFLVLRIQGFFSGQLMCGPLNRASKTPEMFLFSSKSWNVIDPEVRAKGIINVQTQSFLFVDSFSSSIVHWLNKYPQVQCSFRVP